MAATTLLPHLSSDFMNVYYQIRSSQLERSVKGLKEHFRKSSSSSGVPYSPAIPNKRKDTPTKKPIKRPGEPPPRPIKHQPEGLRGTWIASAALESATQAPPELVLTVTLTGGPQDRKQVSTHPARPRPGKPFFLPNRG